MPRPPASLTAPDSWPRRAGVTYRRLDYWATTGLLELPEHHRNPGSGYARYAEHESQRIAVTIHELTAAGLALEVAADISRRYVLDDETRFELGPEIWLTL